MSVLTHFALWTIGLARAGTFYTDEECAALARHAAGRRRLVEIGCWQGVNTRRLRRAMAPDGVLFAVDPYPPGRLGFSAPRIIARREVARVRRGTVEWVRQSDLEAAVRFASDEAPLDFVFSDSLNSYEGFAATWHAWSGLIAPGGRYVLANSVSTAVKPIDGAGSVRFTREAIAHDQRFRCVEVVGCFTVLERLTLPDQRD